jgi:hypothetical protein
MYEPYSLLEHWWRLHFNKWKRVAGSSNISIYFCHCNFINKGMALLSYAKLPMLSQVEVVRYLSILHDIYGQNWSPFLENERPL